LQDAVAFLSMLRAPTVIFWLLLVGSCTIAVAALRADPAQRTAQHICIWLLRLIVGSMWWQQSLWKIPPNYDGLIYWMKQMVDHASQQTADVRLHTPHQSIVQTRDNAFALSRLDVEGAGDDIERRHRERNMREVHAIICREARYYAAGRLLVVVQLRIEEALRDIGNLPGNIELAHHNGIRGRDGWGDVRGGWLHRDSVSPSISRASAG
jgi:hypothetical protein